MDYNIQNLIKMGGGGCLFDIVKRMLCRLLAFDVSYS